MRSSCALSNVAKVLKMINTGLPRTTTYATTLSVAQQNKHCLTRLDFDDLFRLNVVRGCGGRHSRPPIVATENIYLNVVRGFLSISWNPLAVPAASHGQKKKLSFRTRIHTTKWNDFYLLPRRQTRKRLWIICWTNSDRKIELFHFRHTIHYKMDWRSKLVCASPPMRSAIFNLPASHTFRTINWNSWHDPAVGDVLLSTCRQT